MTFQLMGIVTAAGAAWFVTDVGGVSSRGHRTSAAAVALRPGEMRVIHTSLVMYKESLTLFGFGSDVEREAFELVQSASGIGPKVVLATCFMLSPSDLRQTILAEDLRALCRVLGIDNKSAQGLVLELKDKAGLLVLGDAEPVEAVSTGAANELWREQVMGGLQGLGWFTKRAGVACDAVADLAVGGAGVAQLMRAALGTLAKR